MGTSNQVGRLVVVRLVAVLVAVTAMAPTGALLAGAAQSEATPLPERCGVDATPAPVDDERVEIVVRVTPRDETVPLARTVNDAWEVVASRLACSAPEATVVVRRPDRIVVSVSAERDLADVTTLVTRGDVLEIIDSRGQALPVGALITTTLGGPEDLLARSEYAGEEIDESVYETIVRGADIEDAYVTVDQFNHPVVGFELTEDGADRFDEFTSTNIDQPMAIVLNKRVISSPTIKDAIADIGTITGPNPDEVNDLVVQLEVASSLTSLEVVSVGGTPVAGDA